MKVKSESEDTQSCLTLSDPMDWSGLPLPSLKMTEMFKLSSSQFQLFIHKSAYSF